MKVRLIIICFGLLLWSCKDQQGAKTDSTDIPASERTSENDYSDSGKMTAEEPTGDQQASDKDSLAMPENGYSGVYIKTDHPEDSGCSCYCIDMATSGTGELCLKDQELYINTRYAQDGDEIEVYYTGKSSKTTNSEIPWDRFETGTPIAVISPNAEGFDLDWKGFSIDGDLAVDYAILGKKTLEGTYKRK
ncbi:MAG: hypothetical protein ABGW91_13195 [Christiangramia sp.]|nr:hypothetical protein [Christiangramia sp.]|tara:strand:+ start:447 stop:1019 length:573 start_codon:yes stop_codon:yes gene_type:complete